MARKAEAALLDCRCFAAKEGEEESKAAVTPIHSKKLKLPSSRRHSKYSSKPTEDSLMHFMADDPLDQQEEEESELLSPPVQVTTATKRPLKDISNGFEPKRRTFGLKFDKVPQKNRYAPDPSFKTKAAEYETPQGYWNLTFPDSYQN